MDYEKITMYDLIIQASDSLNTANASYNIIVLPVNEFDPTFNSTNETLSIQENTPVDSNVTLRVSTYMYFFISFLMLVFYF